MKRDYTQPKITTTLLELECGIASASDIKVNTGAQSSINIEDEQHRDGGDSGTFLEW